MEYVQSRKKTDINSGFHMSSPTCSALHTHENMHMNAQILEIRIYETTGERAQPLGVAFPPELI